MWVAGLVALLVSVFWPSAPAKSSRVAAKWAEMAKKDAEEGLATH